MGKFYDGYPDIEPASEDDVRELLDVLQLRTAPNDSLVLEASGKRSMHVQEAVLYDLDNSTQIIIRTYEHGVVAANQVAARINVIDNQQIAQTINYYLREYVILMDENGTLAIKRKMYLFDEQNRTRSDTHESSRITKWQKRQDEQDAEDEVGVPNVDSVETRWLTNIIANALTGEIPDDPSVDL